MQNREEGLKWYEIIPAFAITSSIKKVPAVTLRLFSNSAQLFHTVPKQNPNFCVHTMGSLSNEPDFGVKRDWVRTQEPSVKMTSLYFFFTFYYESV